MKLSEMQRLLSERGIRLTKSLGQNFLHDANQLRRIVAAAELTKRDKVLEIGPGLGPLTELLLAGAGHVLTIEKDARLVEVLRQQFKSLLVINNPQLTLLHADALEYLRREPGNWFDWKVVANLPFSVASRILVELAQAQQPPQRMVVTLQLEVAKRLMSKPGDNDYGVLTLLVQLDYEPRNWFKIPASCFFPRPDVDSACIVLMRRPKPLLQDTQRQAFLKLVKRAFSQRRKKMIKLLKPDWAEEQLESAFGALRLPLSARAEDLGLEQFVRLAQTLCTCAVEK